MKWHRIQPIVLLTFKEAVRNRVLYLILIFATIFVLASRIAGLLTVGDEIKVVKDMGLATIAFMDLLIAIFVGIDLLQKEIDKRTVYVILSKPVRRSEFIIGKFLGLTLSLGIVHFATTTLLAGYLSLLEGFSGRIIVASSVTFLEMVIVTSVALMFSSFTTPILSGIFTLGVWIIGRGSRSLLMLAEKLPEGFGRTLVRLLYYLIPNLDRFNLETYAVYDVHLPTSYFAVIAVLFFLYTGVFLSLTLLLFERRNFQ